MTMENILALLLILVIAAVMAWRDMSERLRRMQRRLDELELEFNELRRVTETRAGEPEAVASEPEPEPIPDEQVPDEPSTLPPTPPEPVGPATPTSPKEPEIGAVEPAVALPSPIAPAPSQASRPSIRWADWEQWVGVRGAAVLGGIVLALAALLFLKFAIEHGLIPPVIRVIASVVVGLGAIWGSEVLRKRDYETTANSLAGSGIVILYAAFWAANRLYGLIPTLPAFGLMILVTVACGALAWRHQSLVIAVMGLAGGFATPLLLATKMDNPIGLFGYILMLDTGLLVLARRFRWPSLGILGLAATLFYQALWIFFEMGPERPLQGLVILGVFAGLFALAGTRAHGDASDSEAGMWQVTQTASVMLPFLFALNFAGNAELGTHLWALAGLLLLLSLAAEWIARTQNAPAIGISAAAADVAVVLVWLGRTHLDGALSWEAVVIALALALSFQVFVELDIRSGRALERAATRSKAALVATFGFFVLTVWASLSPIPSFWPWLVGWAGLAWLLIRQAYLPGLAYRQVVASALLGLGFALYYDVHRGTLALPPPGLFLGLAVAAAAVLQYLASSRAFSRKDPAARWVSEIAAAVFPFILLLGFMGESLQPTLSAGAYYVTTITLALLTILVSTRLGDGKILFATMMVLSLEHFFWTSSYPDLNAAPNTAMLAMGAQLLSVALFVAWPFLTPMHFSRDRWVWYAAALAPAVWFLSLRELFVSCFGDSAIGLLPLGLGALSLGAAFRTRLLFAAGDPQRKSNLAWFGAVALGFFSVAIPLQLSREWITIGWAIEGFALLALWKRLDHPGLKYFSLSLLAAVTVRLIANPALLGYYLRTSWPVFNWLMYTYLVPAAALLGSAAILSRLEVGRALDWEKPAYSRGHPLAAIGCGLAAILVIFAWINLTIFDAFSPGSVLTITFDRLPARDLTLSLAWVVYALILLALGMARHSQGLRWISLAFLMLAIGKVFLYDLGELEDLYRVASLVGLAISLILVSLAYQRFVFRQRPEGSE